MADKQTNLKPWVPDLEATLIEQAAENEALKAKLKLARAVKPLVWETPCEANSWLHIARTERGDYGIHIDGGRHRAWLEAHTKPYERYLGDADVGTVLEAMEQAEQEHRQYTISQLIDLEGGV